VSEVGEAAPLRPGVEAVLEEMSVLPRGLPPELPGFTILEELLTASWIVGAFDLTTPISPAVVQALISSAAASHDVWSRALRIFSPASVRTRVWGTCNDGSGSTCVGSPSGDA
jgi:hypothetical protein